MRPVWSGSSALMPDEEIQVTASRNAVTLSGNGEGSELGGSRGPDGPDTGATVIDNLVAPPAVQVLLKVRFAEINRTALRDWATRLRVLNPHEISDQGNWSGSPILRRTETITFLLDSGNEEIQAFVQAATPKGDLRTLAEPNLLTLPARKRTSSRAASSLTRRSRGSGGGSVAIIFKEFGIRLGSRRTSPGTARSGSRWRPRSAPWTSPTVW